MTRSNTESALIIIQIEKLRQQAADKESELMALLKRTPTEVWTADLDQFLLGWAVRTIASYYV